MQPKRSYAVIPAAGLALLALPGLAAAATPVVANALCPVETAFYAPDNGGDIVVPDGFTVSVVAKNLNMPTGIAFLGNSNSFEVYVLESGHGLPSVCNDQSLFGTGDFDPKNPFTPDILVSTVAATCAVHWPSPPRPGDSRRKGLRSILRSRAACRVGGCSRRTRT